MTHDSFDSCQDKVGGSLGNNVIFVEVAHADRGADALLWFAGNMVRTATAYSALQPVPKRQGGAAGMRVLWSERTMTWLLRNCESERFCRCGGFSVWKGGFGGFGSPVLVVMEFLSVCVIFICVC